MFQAKFIEKTKSPLFVFSYFFPRNPAVYEIMWENLVQQDRPQMTIWRMHLSSWIPKAIDTRPEYEKLIALPRQQ